MSSLVDRMKARDEMIARIHQMPAHERVQYGIRRLGTDLIKALRRIDDARVDINSCKWCMLGWLDGDYSKGRVLRGISHVESAHCGFTLIGSDPIGVSEMNTAWRAGLAQLRATHAVPA